MIPNPFRVLLLVFGIGITLAMLGTAGYHAVWLVTHDKDPVMLCGPLILWCAGCMVGGGGIMAAFHESGEK